jgi:hypothetical protein
LNGPDGDDSWEGCDVTFSGKGSAKWGMDVPEPEIGESFDLLTGSKGDAIIKAMYAKLASRPR